MLPSRWGDLAATVLRLGDDRAEFFRGQLRVIDAVGSESTPPLAEI